MRGNLSLFKVDDLKWRTTIPLYLKGANVDALFLESVYPNATVTVEKYEGVFSGRGAAHPYHIFLKFADEADEAEFILREKL